jgi:acetoin:2,6-dichlorophenolindophenol oxidoreductase subunit alpha
MSFRALQHGVQVFDFRSSLPPSLHLPVATQTRSSTAADSHTADFISQYVKAFRVMLLARTLEEKLSSLYKAGRLVGGVYLGRGQEAYSAALGVQLQRGKDVLGPFIRDQAARIAFEEPLLDATRTYFGSLQGPMRGRDGNVHRGRPKEGLPAMISHIGSMVPLVAGMLFGKRMRGELGDAIGATTCGEGGMSTGAFHEGVNLAAVEKLPLLVCVTNNQFSYSTPNERQFANKNLVDRAKGYGIAGHTCDGTDLLDCLTTLRTAAQNARSGGGPQLIIATTLRLTGHGEHDDASYIPAELKKSSVGRDCLHVAEAQVQAKGWATAAEILTWRDDCRSQVEAAVAQASKEAAPDPFRENWLAVSSRELSDAKWDL